MTFPRPSFGLTADLIPDMSLGGNKRRGTLHWTEEMGLAEGIQYTWSKALRKYLSPGLEIEPFSHALLTITVVWPDRTRRDEDNVRSALKPVIDLLTIPSPTLYKKKPAKALLHMGVIERDDQWHLRTDYRPQYKKGMERTTFMLSEIEPWLQGCCQGNTKKALAGAE